MNAHGTVMYKGIRCTLYKTYMNDSDGPLVKITDPSDLDAAYALGFECVGYPDEVVRYISEEEYAELAKQTGAERDRYS